MSAVYTLWAYARVVHGMPKVQYIHGMADLNRREWWTLCILALIAVWWGLKPTAVLDSLSSCVYYWQQCSLATQEPVTWALIFSIRKNNCVQSVSDPTQRIGYC